MSKDIVEIVNTVIIIAISMIPVFKKNTNILNLLVIKPELNILISNMIKKVIPK